MGGPVIPRPHQRVLQERQLVLIIADLVQQPHDEAGCNPPTGHGDRPRDRGTKLVPGHPRDQVLALVDGFGQPGIVHAVPDEIGPHRQHDVDRNLGLPGGFEEQLDERDGFLPGVLDVATPAKPEQLLELIDEDEHVVVGRDAGEPHCVGQPKGAAPEGRLQQHAVRARKRVTWRADHVRMIERLGQAADRVFARPADRHAPARAGGHHEAALKRGNQTGANQRGLPAARCADDRQKPVRAKAADQVVRLLFPSKEEVILLRLVGTQPRERINHESRRVGRRMAARRLSARRQTAACRRVSTRPIGR